MFIFINPWNFTDPEDMPEIPKLSDKGFKIFVGIGILCILGVIACLVYFFRFF